ncbi:MAG: hypothetical protein EPN75_06980 [Beijerinckiaceae bacterium]|nr:MAG: hypothetical protein EPN75_06980 [Beijerinckiaceae bacterium]
MASGIRDSLHQAMICARAAPFKACDLFKVYFRFLFSTEPPWISIDFDKMIYPCQLDASRVWRKMRLSVANPRPEPVRFRAKRLPVRVKKRVKNKKI